MNRDVRAHGLIPSIPFPIKTSRFLKKSKVSAGGSAAHALLRGVGNSGALPNASLWVREGGNHEVSAGD